MRKRKNIKMISILGLLILLLALIAGASLAHPKIHSECIYTYPDAMDAATDTATATTMETVEDEAVPLAAPQTDNAKPVQVVSLVAAQATEAPTPTPAPKQTANGTATPTAEATATPTAEPDNTPDEEPSATPVEPTPTPEPEKAQKPEDTTDVDAMAEYLYDAATEFWATEKDLSGTTTRPVSTRVAPFIGSGTSVDCPGGDSVRVDKNGVEHDCYAIADDFRAYIDMPDLQNFKIYLSEKDYTADPYGAREDVIGTYYQYGSERATYAPDDEDGTD